MRNAECGIADGYPPHPSEAMAFLAVLGFPEKSSRLFGVLRHIAPRGSPKNLKFFGVLAAYRTAIAVYRAPIGAYRTRRLYRKKNPHRAYGAITLPFIPRCKSNFGKGVKISECGIAVNKE